ncbi:DNA polymerase nu [Liparis tanakae]|uniref:DNA polymerase nu n=1 Tax=Liparis tanakae TaxID=230148 RepID=A0A4Z2I2F0_9TELE|nr:DNA polymerase nu [Liparis tanakae]
MEQSSSSLYSGPLSQAAQKILAVLRAQSPHAARRNQHHAYDHRRIVERHNGSQREPWAQSSWSVSQEQSRARDAERLQVASSSTPQRDASSLWQSSQTSACYRDSQTPDCSSSSPAASQRDSSRQRQTSHYRGSRRENAAPHGFQSSHTLSFTQREEMEESVSRRNRRASLSRQIPERISTKEIRTPFIHNLSANTEVLFPTSVQRNAGEEEHALACYRASSGPKAGEETDHFTSDARKENRDSDRWAISRKKLDTIVALDDDAKWKLSPFNPTEEVIGGGDGGGLLYQEGQQRVDSDNMMQAGTAQMSGRDHEMQAGVTCAKMRHLDVHMPNEKGSAIHMEGLLLQGTNENTRLDTNSIISSNMDKSLFSEVAKSGQEEDNDVEYRVESPELPPGIEDKELSHTGRPKNNISLSTGEPEVSRCQAGTPQTMSGTVTAEELPTENPRRQREPTTLVPGDTAADNLEGSTEKRKDVREVDVEVQSGSCAATDDKMETEQRQCSDVETRERQRETDYREASEPEERGADRSESGMPPVVREKGSTEDSGRGSCSTPTLSRECRPKRSGFRAPCLPGNHQRNDSQHDTHRNVRGRSFSLASTSAAGRPSSSSGLDLASYVTKASQEMGNGQLRSPQTHSRHPPLVPSFPLKRKHKVLQPHYADPPLKSYLPRCNPKWEAPQSSQEKAKEGGVGELKRARSKTCVPGPRSGPPEPQTKVSPSHKTGTMSGMREDSCAPEQTRQIRQRARNASKQTASAVTGKPRKHKQDKCGPGQEITGPELCREAADGNELQNQSKAGCLTATLTSDPRVKDSWKMDPDEKMQILQRAGEAKALVLTLVYRDGTTQLDPEQKLAPEVCGLLVLMKNNLDRSAPEDSLEPNDWLVYLKLEHTPAWAQQHTHQSQELFTKCAVISKHVDPLVSTRCSILNTAQYHNELSSLQWQAVVSMTRRCRGGYWILQIPPPATRSFSADTAKGPVSQVISGLYSLYWLNRELCFKLQSQGLWALYSDMELNMISVLAAMESHRIHVDKEALKRTSELLGTKMKQLEQDAHRAAGQIFLVTSSTQLRTVCTRYGFVIVFCSVSCVGFDVMKYVVSQRLKVLFEKLCLHERCENKKLPKTVNKQQQSTSEAALLQLQDLHPLPKIILEYRQNSVSSTWNQTSAVTGRISAKHPNFQALPRQPLQITKKQYVQGANVSTSAPYQASTSERGCVITAKMAVAGSAHFEHHGGPS